MTLLELLQAGRVEEFNGKRGQRVTIDLFAADLANLDLSGVDLSGANLEKADLTSVNLSHASLAKTNLTGVDLTGATLDHCVAIKAKLREVYMVDARAVDAEFSGADFGEADLTGLHAPRARFAGARMRQANLSRATMPGANFSEARMTEIDLRGSEVHDAVFRDADLSKANLEGASLIGADLTNARLGGANLKYAKLTGAKLVAADLSGADLTGATLDEADLTGADLTDATLDPSAIAVAEVPARKAAPVEIHFEDPSIATISRTTAVLWENADEDETLSLMVMVGQADGESAPTALPVNAEQVVARALLPLGECFVAALFVEKPGGVDLTVHTLSLAGEIGPGRSVRLGYAPVVKPVFVAEGNGFLIYGIGRQGALSVHHWEDGVLTERMRAPAGTYRGFCGRLDPVLLGKGGTVAAVRADGIGKLLTAPTGYPGRLVAAAVRPDDMGVALAWVGKGEKGVRFVRVGTDADALRIDAASEASAIDLVSVGDRWLLAWTREPENDRELVLPYACWIGKTGPAGKAFVLLQGDDADDVEDVRFASGGKVPHLGVTTLAGGMIVVAVGESAGAVTCRLG